MRAHRGVLVALLASSLVIPSCSTTTTTVSRETGARPRIEQRALSRAMEDAYEDVHFKICKGKKTFVETKALSQADVEFINAYVQGRALAAGCVPTETSDGAELKLMNSVQVSGTDEVDRRVGRDLVVAQFSGALTVVDLSNGTIVKVFKFDAASKSKRNKKATTRSMG